MELSRTDLTICPPKRCYQALAFVNNMVVMNKYFTTKSEAMGRIRAFNETYDGDGKIDCYIRIFKQKKNL